jgi:hypothetical protein
MTGGNDLPVWCGTRSQCVNSDGQRALTILGAPAIGPEVDTRGTGELPWGGPSRIPKRNLASMVEVLCLGNLAAKPV